MGYIVMPVIRASNRPWLLLTKVLQLVPSDVVLKKNDAYQGKWKGPVE